MQFFKDAELFDTHVSNLKVVPTPKVPKDLRRAGADGGCVVFKFHHGRVPQDLAGCSLRLPFVHVESDDGDDVGNGDASGSDGEGTGSRSTSGYALAETTDPHPVT